MEREHRVTSWAELNELLLGDIYDERLGRHRSPFAYRGVARAQHALLTSLSQLGDKACELESHLLRNFRKYAHRNAVASDTVWNWLALAQHHGLPTRMLDWSFSPNVALHFATAHPKDYHHEGVIWGIRYGAIKDALPKALREVLDEEGSDVFTVDMLTRAAPALADLEAFSKKPFPLFLEPPSIDDRIVNQSALFSLMSSCSATLDQWLKDHPDIYHRIIIPPELKWEIRDKLDQSGVTERVLFPGLDGLSRWLRRYYSPRK